MSNPAACYEKASDLVSRDIAGEMIIVPIRNHVGDLDSIYTLNDAGTFVWRMIDGNTTARQIAEALCNVYDTNFENAYTDTSDLLESLQEKGLIHSVSA